MRTKPICGNCLYWEQCSREMDEQLKDIFIGKCRRFPPTTNGHLNYFPQTKSTTWCGEHKPMGKKRN